jgi:2-phospho-L-lactate guanylyltransferase
MGTMEWTAVVPVKSLPDAKSRLLPDDDPTRPELALAFLEDVLAALDGAAAIAGVVVVTDDERVRRVVDASPARWIAEFPHTGLNPAAAFGAASLAPGSAVAIVAGDLPCLTSDAVDQVLALAGARERAFMSDAQGIGTTMLLDSVAANCSPAFGERSRARHVQLGYVDLGLDSSAEARRLLARARRDVDTQVDLWDAMRIGVGAATSAVLLGALAR